MMFVSCLQAPEMLLKQPYDPRQTDMWSLGAVLYNMVVGRLPYGRIKTLEEARALKPLVLPPMSVMVLTPQVMWLYFLYGNLKVC